MMDAKRFVRAIQHTGHWDGELVSSEKSKMPLGSSWMSVLPDRLQPKMTREDGQMSE